MAKSKAVFGFTHQFQLVGSIPIAHGNQRRNNGETMLRRVTRRQAKKALAKKGATRFIVDEVNE